MANELVEKPFSMSYVLRTTAKHMRKSIDISIRKTIERVEEFAEDQEKALVKCLPNFRTPMLPV